MTNNKSEELSERNESPRVRVTQRTCLSDRWSRLEQVIFDYRRMEGSWQSHQREIYHRGHGAAVLLYNLSLKTVVLTRQFRFPVWDTGDDGFLLEVPAGIVESGDPHETIRKETEEETGFIVEQPEFLFRAYSTPGSVTEQVHYFSAAYSPDERSGRGGGLVDEGEDIEVLEVKFDCAVAWIRNGKIIDAKTIMLIQYAQLHIFTD